MDQGLFERWQRREKVASEDARRWLASQFTRHGLTAALQQFRGRPMLQQVAEQAWAKGTDILERRVQNGEITWLNGETTRSLLGFLRVHCLAECHRQFNGLPPRPGTKRARQKVWRIELKSTLAEWEDDLRSVVQDFGCLGAPASLDELLEKLSDVAAHAVQLCVIPPSSRSSSLTVQHDQDVGATLASWTECLLELAIRAAHAAGDEGLAADLRQLVEVHLPRMCPIMAGRGRGHHNCHVRHEILPCRYAANFALGILDVYWPGQLPAGGNPVDACRGLVADLAVRLKLRTMVDDEQIQLRLTEVINALG